MKNMPTQWELIREIHGAVYKDIPERLMAVEIAVKGNGTKGLSKRMNELEHKVDEQGVAIWKIIVIIVATSSGTAGISQLIGG